MLNPRHSSSFFVFRLVLLAVFVLPSLVPSGYMVSRNPETNLVEITICSGTNHRIEYLDLSTGEYFETTPDAEVEIESVQLCPFALTGLDDQIIQTPISIPASSPPTLFSAFQTVQARVQSIVPVSRGPPVFLS